MKLSLLVLMSVVVYGCTQKTASQLRDENNACAQNTNLTFKQRMDKFPFNVAKRIQFISITGRPDTNEFGGIHLRYDKFPFDNDTLIMERLDEVVTLSNIEIDSLSNLIYNVSYAGDKVKFPLARCFEPHNGILFFDKNNKVFECIQLSFECSKFRTKYKNTGLGALCTAKMERLKKMFLKLGIKSGTSYR